MDTPRPQLSMLKERCFDGLGAGSIILSSRLVTQKINNIEIWGGGGEVLVDKRSIILSINSIEGKCCFPSFRHSWLPLGHSWLHLGQVTTRLSSQYVK